MADPRGGARDARPGSNFFHFHAKNLANNRLHTLRNPGSTSADYELQLLSLKILGLTQLSVFLFLEVRLSCVTYLMNLDNYVTK